MDLNLNPIAQELKSFKTTMGEVATMTNKGFEMALTLEERMSGMEVAEKHLKERIAWLETKGKGTEFKSKRGAQINGFECKFGHYIFDMVVFFSQFGR